MVSVSRTPATNNAVPRRKFLIWAAAGTLALAVADATRIVFTFLQPQPKGGFGSEITAGAVEDFSLGSVTLIRQGRFFIVHVDDGLLALYRRCTHLGCLVPWDEEQGRFACPCHAGRYNRVGEVIGGPPPRPLDLFELKVVDGQVVVDTGKIISRKRYEPSQAAEM
jgi:cytochrome b6-f complex iron-sulfur subunit